MKTKIPVPIMVMGMVLASYGDVMPPFFVSHRLSLNTDSKDNSSTY